MKKKILRLTPNCYLSEASGTQQSLTLLYLLSLLSTGRGIEREEKEEDRREGEGGNEKKETQERERETETDRQTDRQADKTDRDRETVRD